MFERARLLYLYVETPLHAGSGAGLGVVELPLQRERVTGYPMVQGSGLKGALRAEARRYAGEDEEQLKRLKLVFGPDTERASEHAGAVGFGDARLLLFPVRSLTGVFAWTTSEDVLVRFARDAELAGLSVPRLSQRPDDEELNVALVPTESEVTVPETGRVVLEEFAFEARSSDEVTAVGQWLADHALPTGDAYDYWRAKLPRSLVVLKRDDFRDFTHHATEVITRIKLKEDGSKTVQTGGLWSEEHLPTDALLYAPLYAGRPRGGDLPAGFRAAEDVLCFVKLVVAEHGRIQLGGDETVGRGLVALRFS